MKRKSTSIRGAITALVIAIASASVAQGFFYQEVQRDGRIYVFNQMKDYENFQKTGEMGKSITRVGMGPKGETVIFDTDDAIHLYNFRNGREGEVMAQKEEPKATSKMSWKDGKTSLEFDKAKVTLSNRLQFRYSLTDPDGADTAGSFRVRRFKSKLAGWAYAKELEYELQLNWADSSKPLEDANMSYDFTGGHDEFTLKAGQFKAPFGRQELTSSGSQQFVDRSMVSNEFAKGRDIGLQVGGQAANSQIEWAAGMFNGNGRGNSSNDNDKYQYTARLMWQPMGAIGYSEGDFESKDTPLFALAVNFDKNDKRGSSSGADTDHELYGVDGAFKYRGFSAFGEYFLRKSSFDADGDGVVGPDVEAKGFHAQVGYFLMPKTFEIAGRYAWMDLSDLSDRDDRKEWGVSMNYYMVEHKLKLQGDWRQLENDAKGTKDHEFRLQSQIVF